MRKTKRMFPNFQYRECDAFAKYLERQAATGWHFKEWRFGLVFEKGEPGNVTYSVEIFPKGSEMDMKPGELTQEYAEYCAAAGWKLLDSHGKVCIFKREWEEAVPIVEPEERLENISKAEKERWRGSSLVAIGLTLLYLFEFWKFNFEHWIFDNTILALILIMLLLAASSICEAVYLARWKRKQKRRLSSGGIVTYGKSRWFGRAGKFLFFVALIFMSLNKGVQQQDVYVILGAVIMFGGIGIVSVIISLWRPLEVVNETFQLLTMFGLASIFVILLTAGIFDREIETEPKDIPLLQADYLEMQGEPEIFFEEIKSVFGDAFHGDVTYRNVAGSVENALVYEVYHSPYQWVIDKLWKQIYRYRGPQTDCKELWNAKEAYQTGADGVYWYYVQYPKDVVMIHVEMNHELDKEDIAVMRERLELP